jgi:DNA-binding transcriptional LysR family regulator
LDRLDAMTVLLAVVDEGSLSAGARRLRTPLATVSRKVAELEAHLGTKLLVRSSRRVSLTEAGQSYIEACKRILEQVSEAERAAAGEYTEPKGELTITAPVVFGRLHVLPVVVDFLKVYPEINLRLILADRVMNLIETHVDLAVRIGDLPDSGLLATRLGAVRRVMCAAPSLLDVIGRPRKPEDLEGQDCIATVEGVASVRAYRFRTPKGEISVPMRSRLTVSEIEAAIDACEAGLGLMRVLSYQVVAARRERRLELVLEDFEPEPWPVHIVYLGQGLLPLKLRAFLDFATPRLRASLSAAG